MNYNFLDSMLRFKHQYHLDKGIGFRLFIRNFPAYFLSILIATTIILPVAIGVLIGIHFLCIGDQEIIKILSKFVFTEIFAITYVTVIFTACLVFFKTTIDDEIELFKRDLDKKINNQYTKTDLMVVNSGMLRSNLFDRLDEIYSDNTILLKELLKIELEEFYEYFKERNKFGELSFPDKCLAIAYFYTKQNILLNDRYEDFFDDVDGLNNIINLVSKDHLNKNLKKFFEEKFERNFI